MVFVLVLQHRFLGTLLISRIPNISQNLQNMDSFEEKTPFPKYPLFRSRHFLSNPLKLWHAWEVRRSKFCHRERCFTHQWTDNVRPDPYSCRQPPGRGSPLWSVVGQLHQGFCAQPPLQARRSSGVRTFQKLHSKV